MYVKQLYAKKFACVKIMLIICSLRNYIANYIIHMYVILLWRPVHYLQIINYQLSLNVCITLWMQICRISL